MAFESKQLRVQLPCKAAASLVERQIPGPECWYFRSLFPQTPCRFHTPPCLGFFSQPEFCPGFRSDPCNLTGSVVPCRLDSRIPVFDFTERILPDPEEKGAVLMNPEDLPLVRRQLEAELAEIAALRERGEQIEGQLQEIASVEKELKKRQG